MQKDKNIIWHAHKLSRAERSAIKGHGSCVIWFTGLSASGKSTIANELEGELHKMGVHTFVLDGDNIRHGLNKGLGFSADDRKENIRRIGEVAKLFTDAGVIAITAFISPFAEDRDLARSILPEGEFIEVYTRCPLEVCCERDPKGLYKKAKAGEIKDFTGISHPYEEPLLPELTIDTDKLSVEEGARKVIAYLHERKIIKKGAK